MVPFLANSTSLLHLERTPGPLDRQLKGSADGPKGSAAGVAPLPVYTIFSNDY